MCALSALLQHGNAQVLEASCACLAQLLHSEPCREALDEAGGTLALVELLQRPEPAAVEAAAAAVAALSAGGRYRALCANSGAIDVAADLLLSIGTSRTVRIAATILRNLSAVEALRGPIVDADVVPSLLLLMDSADAATAAAAVTALGNLSRDERAAAAMATAGAPGALLRLLQGAEGGVANAAAAAVAQLLHNDALRDALLADGLLGCVMAMLSGVGSCKVPEGVVACAAGLAALEEAHGQLAPAVPLLTLLLSHPSGGPAGGSGVRESVRALHRSRAREGGGAKEHAAAALALLASSPSCRQELLQCGGAAVLVATVKSGSAVAVEHAIAALARLACGDAARDAIADAGGIDVLVSLLAPGCDARVAGAALRALRSVAIAPLLQQRLLNAGGAAAILARLRRGKGDASFPALLALLRLLTSNAKLHPHLATVAVVPALLGMLGTALSKHVDSYTLAQALGALADLAEGCEEQVNATLDV